jgi:glucose/arabinose dehydrogenase
VFSESGLLGMAFHPNFPATPFVYVNYTVTGSGVGNLLTSRISRFQTLDGGLTLSPDSEQFVLEIPQPFVNHNGGNLAFGPDGFLYAAFGDGGSAGDPQDNAQNDHNLLGTIIRIDIDSATPYAIPPTNFNEGNAVCTQGFGAAPCPEIFAWGLRNPWKFSFDRVGGELWAGDVGQDSWEEIDLVISGANYGWRQREGAHCFDPASGCADIFSDPVAEYPRSVGQSVTGGYVYRGSAITDLVGWYVFGDFQTGRLLGFLATSQPVVTPIEFDDTPLFISTFAEDIAGELYLMDYVTGTIFQIIED